MDDFKETFARARRDGKLREITEAAETGLKYLYQAVENGMPLRDYVRNQYLSYDRFEFTNRLPEDKQNAYLQCVAEIGQERSVIYDYIKKVGPRLSFRVAHSQGSLLSDNDGLISGSLHVLVANEGENISTKVKTGGIFTLFRHWHDLHPYFEERFNTSQEYPTGLLLRALLDAPAYFRGSA